MRACPPPTSRQHFLQPTRVKQRGVSFAAQVEFDVRMTADKECVILHDATVDRTTNGSGNIWDLTLAEVKALEVLATVPNQGKNRVASHDNSFRSRTPTGEKIPTFTELLDSLSSGLELNVRAIQ